MPTYDRIMFDSMIKALRDVGMLPIKPLCDFGIKGGRALDIGCGSGIVGLEWLKESRAEALIGIDYDSEMLGLAEVNRCQYKKHCNIDLHSVGFEQADACSLPFDDESFDAVFSFNVLHEVSDPVKMLNEAHRVTRRGGLFCIRDLHSGGDWTTLDWASKLPRIDDFRPVVRACLAGAFNSDRFVQVVEESAMKSAERIIRPMLLCVQGRKG